MKVQYDRDVDALYVTLAEGQPVARTVRIDRGTMVDVDRFGRLIGIELIRPARQWPLDEIVQRFTVDAQDARLLRDLQGGAERRFAFAQPADIAV